MKVFDEGNGFDIESFADSEVKETDEQGRGIPLIYRLMSHVQYRKQRNGCVLEMIKELQ
jgi:anti-sigma regulatory factor (Ser/Thr protein kinase)